MTETMKRALELDSLVLKGLHTGSLGHYLAALGLLNAIRHVEGADEIRGYWRNGQFLLYGLDKHTLGNFLLNTWNPSPFKLWWREVQEASKKDSEALPKLRATVPDEKVDQLDAVMVQAKRRVFNDIFGTGGNVGKRDLARLWEKCSELTRKAEAGAWLEHTLFGLEDTLLPKLTSAGTWFAFSNKVFNSGQDWYREGRLSPWSFLLAVEGALLLRGGVHKRLGSQTQGIAAFPFMCRPLSAPAEGQVGQRKSEFWGPIWSKPATLAEVESLFRGGLMEVGGRLAVAPHEFAVAAMDAAVDAGITTFIRFELCQTTSAQVYEALPREEVPVDRRYGESYSRLVLPLISSHWIERLPVEPRDTKQRGRFVGLRGPVEEAIIRLSEEPDDPERWRTLLLLIARTQERVDLNKNLRERCIPLPRLSQGWFERAWPSRPVEIEVSRAVASMGAGTTDPILFNIFGIERKSEKYASFPKARPVRAVWNNGLPTSVFIDIIKRRLLDVDELESTPLKGTQPCGLNAIASFLSGEGFDFELTALWVPALALIDWKPRPFRDEQQQLFPSVPLNPLYSLFRPLVDPEGLVIGGTPLFPLREDDTNRLIIV